MKPQSAWNVTVNTKQILYTKRWIMIVQIIVNRINTLSYVEAYDA